MDNETTKTKKFKAYAYSIDTSCDAKGNIDSKSESQVNENGTLEADSLAELKVLIKRQYIPHNSVDDENNELVWDTSVEYVYDPVEPPDYYLHDLRMSIYEETVISKEVDVNSI